MTDLVVGSLMLVALLMLILGVFLVAHALYRLVATEWHPNH